MATEATDLDAIRDLARRNVAELRAEAAAPGPYTLPPSEQLAAMTASFPDWMHPSPNPFGVVYPGALTPAQCEELVACVTDEQAADTFHFPGCGATTRQYATHGDAWSSRQRAALRPIADLARSANSAWWRYAIDVEPAACLQTYGTTTGYPVHMDTSPGQSRKLTAVAMLTPAGRYDGGVLTLITGAAEHRHYAIPREQGTVVVFQPWLMHWVSDITGGPRQTVNMGFYGSPFDKGCDRGVGPANHPPARLLGGER